MRPFNAALLTGRRKARKSSRVTSLGLVFVAARTTVLLLSRATFTTPATLS